MNPDPRSGGAWPVLRRTLLCGLLLLSALPILRAAQPPAWLVPLLTTGGGPRPDAEAVVLCDEVRIEYLPEGRQLVRERRASRLLTRDGLGALTTGCPYNADTDRVRKAQAWILTADGKKTESFGRSEFQDLIVHQSDLLWDSGRIFYFPPGQRLAVDGVLAWEVEIERTPGLNDTSCFFQGALPIRRASLEVVPRPGESLRYFSTGSFLPAPVPGPAPGSLRWEAHDLPATPRHTPPGYIPNPRLLSVHAVGPQGGSADTWPALVRRICEVVVPRLTAAVPSAVERWAREASGTQTERWARIRAVGGRVQRDITYLSVAIDKDSLAGLRPRPPAEVLTSRLGDCKDKAVLLVNLLRSIGEPAYPVLVRANDLTGLRPDWPSMSFNHMIVGVPAGAEPPPGWPVLDGGPLGPLVLFDPTDPRVPLGRLPLSDQGCLGMVLDPGTTGPATLPVESAAQAAVERTITAVLAPEDVLEISYQEEAAGALAAQSHGDRVVQGDEKFRVGLERWLRLALPQAELGKWEDRWEEATGRWHVQGELRSPHATRSLGPDRMMLTPRLLGGDTRAAPWKEAAEGWVWLRPEQLKETLRLRLPAGTAVERLPADWSLEEGTGRARLHYAQEGGEIVFTREFSHESQLCGAGDYEKWRRFCQQVNEAERRPLILRRSPTAP